MNNNKISHYPIIPTEALNEERGNFPYSWTAYKKMYVLSNISVSSIVELQKEQIKNYAYNDNSVLTQLNQELQELNSDFSTEIEKQVVQNIENNFHGLRKRFEEAESLGINFNDEIEKLLKSYQDLIGQVMALNNINYSQLDSIGKSMYKLQTDINLLRQWLTSAGESGRTFAEMEKLRILNSKTTNARFATKKNKNKTPSLLNQLVGIGNALKGLELEKVTTEKIADRLPDFASKTQKFENGIKVINIGAIRVDIGKGSVDIKEDISIFDMAFKNSEIQLANGKSITLEELILKLEGQESITLNNEGYEQLQKMMVSAVSAKTTKNQIQLHAGLTVDRILSESKDNSYSYWALKHLHQLKMANSNFRGDSNYNTLLINYNMSKMLTKIIGLKNDFLVTKEGFVSMYDYINNLLTEQKYIHVNKATLDKSMKVVI